MKKEYTAPQSAAINLISEGKLLTDSYHLNEGKAPQWTNQKDSHSGGWDSNSWSDESE